MLRRACAGWSRSATSATAACTPPNKWVRATGCPATSPPAPKPAPRKPFTSATWMTGRRKSRRARGIRTAFGCWNPSAPTPRSTIARKRNGSARSPMRRIPKRRIPVDKAYITRGVKRCSTQRFLLWVAPWAALLVFGLYCAGLCLVKGLNQTNMDNRFAFGLWIFLDLTVIALGAGAFFTGFLLYILKFKELKAVINSAVVIGLVCYSGAMAALMVDVGQPLRAWFTFWYPNVHSMLTEVTFCISCYLAVLLIEYLPIVLRNRKLREVPAFLVFEFELHKLIYVLAGVGTFLSFFHQGSLGGLYGVLRGRPFAFREGIFVWPSTFFLFILSAAAVGPSFIILTTSLVEKITKKRLVKRRAFDLLARISGLLLAVYVLAKTLDTLIWINRTSPAHGFTASQYYDWKPFGTWILFADYRPVWNGSRTDPANAPAEGAPRLADFRGGAGLQRRGAQPLRADHSNFGAADAFLRQVPFLYAELAGDGHIPGRGCLRCSGVLLLVPLLPGLSRRARTGSRRREVLIYVSMELWFSLGRRQLSVSGRLLHGGGSGGHDASSRIASRAPRSARQPDRAHPLAFGL